MADKVIENLITKLTFDFDEEKIEKFNEGIKTAVKGITAVVGASAAAAAAIFGFTKKMAEANDETGKFAQRIGVDVESLQELGYVAELNGASVDSMNGTLQNLAKISSEAAMGMGSGVEAFGRLGVSATDASGKVKSADDLFAELADSISGLGTQAEKLELSQKLGIDSSLLLALDQGTEALIRQKKEAQELGFAFGKDGTKAAADFNDEFLRVRKVVLGVANAVGTKLMKTITPMMKTFVEWFKINKKIIQQRLQAFLDGLITVISGVFSIMMRVVGVLNNIVMAFGGWENALKLVTAAILTMTASLWLTPLALLAIAAGILLLIEDFQKFAEGGDSAIGALIEKFPLLEAPVRGIIKLFKMIAEGWMLIFTQGDEALEGAIMMIQDFIAWIKKLVGVAVDAGANIVKAILEPLKKGFNLIQKIPGIDKIKNLSIFGGKENENTNPVPTAAVGESQSITNNTTNNNTSKPNVSINVNGGNPAEVKQAVRDVLDEQYAGAVANLETGVEF